MSWEVLYCADSFAELKNIPAGEFDHVITDPPYDKKCQENQISGTDVAHNGGGIGVPHIELPFAPLVDYDFARDLVRVAKRWAIVFGTVESFGVIQALLGDAVLDPKNGAYVRGAIWYKPNAQGQMTGDRPAACYEGINVLHRPGPKYWNGHGSYALWPCNGTRGEKDRHPNQKPLELALKLVALFTNRGETVFDPFCGSGRIGEACVLLGRNYVGFDLPEHDEERVIREKVDGKFVRRKITVREDWVLKARVRLYEAEQEIVRGFGCTDEYALKLCTAKKVDILEDAA
jgi:site-specific DNA-methyltransferase (adenine-specific)